MPITKTIWRGKVGTRDSGARNVNVPITSMPVTSISCTLVETVYNKVPYSARNRGAYDANLVSGYQLPVTSYQLLATSYQLPVTH